MFSDAITDYQSVYEVAMPNTQTVEAFISLVESGGFVAAMRAYYHDDAAMQENGDPPRRGLETLVTAEQRTLAAFSSVKCKRLSPPAIDGDRVAIAWRFEFTPREGPAKILEEVAWQRWSGDKIVEERFFYDPRQLAG